MGFRRMGGIGCEGMGVSPAMARRLALQDWSLGPMFALLPAMKSARNARDGALALLFTAAHSFVFLAAASLSSFVVAPWLRRGARLGGAELRDLGLVGLCLSAAALSEHVGLGMEIGAFAAGVMVGGGSDKGAAVVEDIDPVRGLFSALQSASVGILFKPGYCLRHAPALAMGLVGDVVVHVLVGVRS